MSRPDRLSPNVAQRTAALEARFARAIAVRLSQHAESVAPDVSERLRFSREKAVEAARRARGGDQVARSGWAGGAAVATLTRSPLWWRVASALPLLALVLGLLWIQDLQSSLQISTAAEVDAELLGDDLPINAYMDAGFLEFLKTPRDE